MTAPTPVVLVKDKKSGKQLLGMLIGNILGLFLTAWILMLLLPVVAPVLALGYWQAFAALFVSNILFKVNLGSYASLYMRDSG